MKRFGGWMLGSALGLTVGMAGAQDLGAQERGWEPLVSDAQARAYEFTRYAPAVRIGNLLIGSGVIGVDMRGDNSPEAQFRRAWENLRGVLEQHGLDLGDVAEITTYHVNLGEHGRSFMDIKNEFIPEPPYPAWTAIGVDRLFLDQALIEIRFTAAFPEGR